MVQGAVEVLLVRWGLIGPLGQEGAYGIRAKGVVQQLTLGETKEGLRIFRKVDGTELGHVKMMQEMPKKGGLGMY